MASSLMLAALAAGCVGRTASETALSSSFYPVQGKVVLPDGKAPTPLRVVFSGPVTTNATTDGGGSFVVKGTKDGLPAGEYRVRLEVVDAKGPAKKPVLPFPAKYLDEDTSELTATVKPEGSNDFEFKLNNELPAAIVKAAQASTSRRGR